MSLRRNAGWSQIAADAAAAIDLVKVITCGAVLFGEMNPREAMPKLLSMYEAGSRKLDGLRCSTR